MKNVLNDNPKNIGNGRLKYTLNKFVSKKDIKNKSVLDIGCGYGWFELFSLKHGVKKIVGTEITDIDLETARKHIKNKKVVFDVASAIELPYKNSTFDTVVSWEVLEHIPKNTEQTMFSEVSRVLNKNGSFYLSTPYASYIARFFDPAWWIAGHRHYTKKQLLTFAEKAGFKIVTIEVRGNWWQVASILNMYASKWIFRRKTFLSNFIHERVDKGYEQEGFMSLFVHMKKK